MCPSSDTMVIPVDITVGAPRRGWPGPRRIVVAPPDEPDEPDEPDDPDRAGFERASATSGTSPPAAMTQNTTPEISAPPSIPYSGGALNTP